MLPIRAVSKDSDVLLDLAIKSGVPFEAQHNHTTVDAPPTVYHIREVFKRLTEQGIANKINMPPEITDVDGKIVRATMWNLIPTKLMPPTRKIRYCCEYFKERIFDGQHLLVGVRWSESNSRKKRGLHENRAKKKEDRILYFDENDESRKLTDICRLKSQIMTNPLIDWTDLEIWEYVRRNGIKMNPLYEQGFKRVGCVGCPMAGPTGQWQEFEMFPKYKRAYIKAFERMIEERKRREKNIDEQWQDGESVFKWWTDPKYDLNQITFEFDYA